MPICSTINCANRQFKSCGETFHLKVHCFYNVVNYLRWFNMLLTDKYLYVFCAYDMLIEECHHRRLRDLIFYKLASLQATANTRPSSLHRVYISITYMGCSIISPINLHIITIGIKTGKRFFCFNGTVLFFPLCLHLYQ